MITPLQSRRHRRRFLVYDLEWVPGKLEVRVVGVYDGLRYRAYPSIAAFLQGEITHENRGKWFYAHAGGLADVQFILHEIGLHLRSAGFRVDCVFSGSSAIIVRITKDKHSWVLVDSYWLLKDKLSEVAKWVGLEKGGEGYLVHGDPEESGITEAEYNRRMQAKREWYASVDWKVLRGYNETDCLILWHAIDGFENTLLELGGQLKMTVASCAMELFRRKYLHRSVDTSDRVNAKAQLAYSASRVEDIQEYVWDAYYYDINSSFPYAMTHACPGNFLGFRDSLPDNDHTLYLAEVTVSVPEMNLPPLPYRHKERLFFPTGEWRGWLDCEDIRLLQRVGGSVRAVHEVWLFEPFWDLAAYAADLFDRRAKASSAMERIVYKYMLNSLYGKFAEGRIKTNLALGGKPESESASHLIEWMPGVWAYEKEVDVPHQHVPISTHITAVARRVLYDYSTACCDVFYFDTDGFCSTEILPVTTTLGGLKLEKRVQEGRFAGPKMYYLRGLEKKQDQWVPLDYVKAKGFSRMTRVDKFLRMLEGEAIDFERMTRIRENVRHGDLTPREVTIRKKVGVRDMYSPQWNPRTGLVAKRFHYPDGHTRPWSVTELRELLP